MLPTMGMLQRWPNKSIMNLVKLKEASLLFVIQVFTYAVFCVNFRAVSDAQYHTAAISDFILASTSFFVIRKIAHGQDHIHQWAGYALGGVAGSYLGIWLSITYFTK